MWPSVALAAALMGAAAGAAPPNIVVLFVDDFGVSNRVPTVQQHR